MASNTKSSPAPRFRVLDALILLIVLICIAALVFRIYFTNDLSDRYEYATLEFSVIDVAENNAALIVADSPLYLDSNNHKIGTILDASYAPLQIFAKDGSGNMIPVQHPTRITASGVASVRGIWTDDGFMLDGTILATTGKTVTVYTDKVVCVLTIHQVNKAQ